MKAKDRKPQRTPPPHKQMDTPLAYACAWPQEWSIDKRRKATFLLKEYRCWYEMHQAMRTGRWPWPVQTYLKRMNWIAQFYGGEFWSRLHAAAAFFRRWAIYNKKHRARPDDPLQYTMQKMSETEALFQALVND